MAERENVVVGVYNPVTPAGLFKLNYRMHDKYVIVDDEMYLLGGRNSNDIFLGDYTTDINVDRDILVWDITKGEGESLQELEAYFRQIWNEDCVQIKGGRKKNSSDISVSEEAADDSEDAESNSKNSNIVNGIPNVENEITDETQEKLSKYEKQYQSLEMRYASLKVFTSIQKKLLVNTINQQFDFHTSFGSLIQCCKKICSAFICPQIKGCQYNTLLRRSNHPQTPQKCLFIVINTADPFAP